MDENGAYRTTFDPAGSAHPSTVASHLLADAAGVDASAAMAAIAESFDLEALDHLFAPTADGTRRANGLVDLVALGHEVTVYADGEVVVRPTA